MQQLIFPIDPDGYIVPVLIGLHADAIADLVARGLPVPAPLRGTGLIDSGSTVTGVAAQFLGQYLLQPAATGTTTTAAGEVEVKLYEVSLSIAPPGGAVSPLFAHPRLLVTELTHDIAPIDVLIGRDVINQCIFSVNGPRGEFSLIF